MAKTEERITDLESVKRYLEKKGEESAPTVDNELPQEFLGHLVVRGLRLDLIEPGRIVFSMKIPPNLLNSSNCLHGGAITTLVDLVGATAVPTAGFSWSSGVSVEINVSCLDAAYVDEEIEIDGRVLRVGKTIAVISVELRKKKTGQIFAQGRHTKYIPFISKM
ncbi:putative acyl-CoA hydrolase [Medicago truncatula]|nr:acyl-coenzyme A thioesterase 13 [Medicago truncatula]AES72955.1 acyl-CoA thioesterase, putative [Medicago truncatula]RHN70035.1 putative acyl-CoA hydrolase [Medicago truncatula]